ncbi:MAG: tRNA (cytidine(34)-2'-O)-methyltransferase [Eubacteriales bacterium]|nr:tRNA (cytidine(34)-2'-O)-methyltransferase [Eubacteriales bacterium]
MLNKNPDINVVLVEPEIPQNTGNIARTCAATGSALHLVRPLGYEITDAKLRRAGLDYWYDLNLTIHDSLTAFLEYARGEELILFTTKARQRYTDVTYPERVFLLFGKETAGLPASLLSGHAQGCVRLPMLAGMRSLNLSNTVAVAVYEALRRYEFSGLK